MFDWISFAYFLVIGACALIGFIKGGFRTLFVMIITGAAIGVAFLGYKGLASLLYGTPLRATGEDALRTFFETSISFDASGDWAILVEGGKVTGTTEIPRVVWESEAFRSELYDAIHVLEPLKKPIDTIVNDALGKISGDKIELALPIAVGLTSVLCTALSFVILFGGIFLIGLLVMLIFGLVAKKNGKKKGIVNRLVGAVIGLGTAVSILWTASLVLNVLVSFDNDIGNTIKTLLAWDNDAVWTFAKWCTKTDFGYSGILQNFLQL